MGVRLIVFDLDETLVHATETPLPSPRHFKMDSYLVYVRPFASELIDMAASRFDVAVWSSSSERYVEAVTAELFGQPCPVKFSCRSPNACRRSTPKLMRMCMSKT